MNSRRPLPANLHRLLQVINLKTLIIAATAVLATYLCRRYEIIANFPITLITLAIVFPVVFSIGGAYNRREAVLREYGNIKAHGKAIYFATRDWLTPPDETVVARNRQLLSELLFACRHLFSQPVSDLRQNEAEVYELFSQLSQFIQKEFRERGMASGEISRCNQYLSKMYVAFENIKHIYQYRTPRSLRTFSDIFISILPALYGPYFASISLDYSPGLEYVMPILFSFILVSLSNIQQHLENPFDQVGEDDVTINAEIFASYLR